MLQQTKHLLKRKRQLLQRRKIPTARRKPNDQISETVASALLSIKLPWGSFFLAVKEPLDSAQRSTPSLVTPIAGQNALKHYVGKIGKVGMGGFEPPTSRTLSECANRTALHPEATKVVENLLGNSTYHSI